MPLPPLPANNTNRYWLKYTWGSTEHEVCFRFPTGTADATATLLAGDFATAMKPYIGTADSFSALRKSVGGSIISTPMTWTPVAGTGANPSTDMARAGFVALSGRSSGGYRCRITFFCNGAYSNSDFRASTATAGPQTALYSLIGPRTPPLVAVDGNAVVWNAYVNQGFNAYWQREFR